MHVLFLRKDVQHAVIRDRKLILEAEEVRVGEEVCALFPISIVEGGDVCKDECGSTQTVKCVFGVEAESVG